MKRLIITLASLIATYVFVYPITLYFLGYYPWGVGWDVAKTIVEKNGNVYDCKKIIHPIAEPMSPTAGEQRSSCIHEYAKLTKDPSACELLMPSNYGWDCLGQAEEPSARMCWFDFGKNAKKVGENTMPECGGSPDVADRCCSMAEDLFVKRVASCDTFADVTILHDQCLEELAQREKDIEICSSISNENVRTGCEVAVRALKKM